MYTFKDLCFIPIAFGGSQAKMMFLNGYGISVLLGDRFYSNGVNLYEVAPLKDGKVFIDNDICHGDVLGWQTEEQVTEVMRKIQEL